MLYTLDIRSGSIRYGNEEFLSLPVAVNQGNVSTILCEYKHLSDMIQRYFTKQEDSLGKHRESSYFKVSYYYGTFWIVAFDSGGQSIYSRIAKPEDTFSKELSDILTTKLYNRCTT